MVGIRWMLIEMLLNIYIYIKKSNPANCVQPLLMQAACVINLLYRPVEKMWKNFMWLDRMLVKFLHIELTFVLKPHSII